MSLLNLLFWVDLSRLTHDWSWLKISESTDSFLTSLAITHFWHWIESYTKDGLGQSQCAQIQLGRSPMSLSGISGPAQKAIDGDGGGAEICTISDRLLPPSIQPDQRRPHSRLWSGAARVLCLTKSGGRRQVDRVSAFWGTPKMDRTRPVRNFTRYLVNLSIIDRKVPWTRHTIRGAQRLRKIA